MNLYVITASIRKLDNLKLLIQKFHDPEHKENNIKMIVIDEIDNAARKYNRKIMSVFDNTHFFGKKEREEWLKSRFGLAFKKYESVIPKRCHAETSFGFLVAYEEDADVIMELDDDVAPNEDYNVGQHLCNLFSNNGTTVFAKTKWYNTMENLILNRKERVFPRGHPYDKKCRQEEYRWIDNSSTSVLNMGLWAGEPDLDALTLIYHSGLDGSCHLKGVGLKREKVIVGKDTYFAICSMNTSFLSKIIPAFYQLNMNQLGIDRFDDIWSGLFLKKIADYMRDNVSIGAPLLAHKKVTRDSFSDLRKEMEGIDLNERVWRVVDGMSLSGNSYLDAYISLTRSLSIAVPSLGKTKAQHDFLKMQVEKMQTWASLVDSLN
jgi:hypothetical protein